MVLLKLLLSIDGIGPHKIFSLLNYFKSFDNILEADLYSLLKVDGININLSQKLLNAKSKYESIKNKVENELNKLSKINARIITYWDNDYPELLKKIYYPPLIIYTKGSFTEQDKYSLAVVGTRQPTTYGKIQTEKIVHELVEKNITIVSGLARGIDTIAHKSALNSNGRTIAVIGSGLDVVYPPENYKLFNEITEKGVIITEYELGTKPDAQNFPRRNRIISGLSLGTLVIETKIDGGAMQTAAYAIDQNREVFAIPGNINVKQAEGPNKLIQRGEAKLITNAEDILQELEIKLKPLTGKNIQKPSVELTLFEEKLLQVIGTEAKHIDEIALLSSMSTSDCLVNLLTLEFKGLIKQLPGKMFVLAD
ncbi:DNA-processing protein DprA [Rosettibacter firmus]|uniref:DNA-processing protein DprA n=1 Tax=Rosettibacter firmus TaxID=3111522 RepID=UPI00336BB947